MTSSAECCRGKDLLLTKTKKMVIDFRRTRTVVPLISILGEEMKVVVTYKAGSVLRTTLEPLEVVLEKKMLQKLLCNMGKTSHPLNRVIQPHCDKDDYRKSAASGPGLLWEVKYKKIVLTHLLR